MKAWVPCLFVAALLIAAPEAGAETIQTVDTVSVVGIGRVPLPPAASAAQADTVYHQALTQAVGDGLLKARLLAGATGAHVGPIDAISERGNKGFECKNAAGESASYNGAQPDSGVAELPTVAVKPAAPPRPAKPAARSKKRHARRATRRKNRRVIARKAENVAVSCELETEVSLIYSLES